MYCSVIFFTSLLLWIPHNRAAVAIDIYSIQNEVAEFNLTCAEDSCDYAEIDTLSSRSCLCGIPCVQLGACCVDSYYAAIPQPKLKPTCQPINRGKSYYMVDKCPSSDSAWASLCNNEWNGDDDVHKIVPVTSLLTSITYKNYYCFRCHEATDEFLYWVVKIESNDTQSESIDDQPDRIMALIYNKEDNTWMATCDEGVGYFPVTLSLQIPFEINRLVHACELDAVSDCAPNWYDEQVRNSCLAYMALKEVKRDGGSVIYKNIHCALCNFENFNDVSCRMNIVASVFTTKKPFSFTYLLDINRSDGEIVGKVQKCPNEHVWDPYAKKCRKLTCALPGFKVKNGKCVQD